MLWVKICRIAISTKNDIILTAAMIEAHSPRHPASTAILKF